MCLLYLGFDERKGSTALKNGTSRKDDAIYCPLTLCNPPMPGLQSRALCGAVYTLSIYNTACTG